MGDLSSIKLVYTCTVKYYGYRQYEDENSVARKYDDDGSNPKEEATTIKKVHFESHYAIPLVKVLNHLD
jgi:hypothetical protein